MTREELKKEATEYAKKHRMLSYCGPADIYVSDEEEIINAILFFAEPREKRIAELEAQIEKMKFEVVKEAFRQGKVIQYNLDGEWVDWSEPTFDDKPCNYRIKEVK
jgi:hypothetical protein